MFTPNHRAVWINLLIIFISMGFIAHSPPNFVSAMAAYGIGPGPILKSKFVSLPLFNKVNGIMNMVFAYGGAMIFPEFMAEMRRPMDFWKGMVRICLSPSTQRSNLMLSLSTVLRAAAHHCRLHDVRNICVLVPGTVHPPPRIPGCEQVLLADCR